jgi:5'-nucleotidase / UDP-sugar diphosphatase
MSKRNITITYIVFKNRLFLPILLGALVILSAGSAVAADSPTRLTIMHTNDIHSHMQGFGPEGDYTPLSPNDDLTAGGFARLAAKIGSVREERAKPGTATLLLDAGDFMMGTAFTLLRGEAELSIMDLLGYDVITLGNHEFDWGPVETAKIFGLIPTLGLNMKAVASNMIFSSTSTRDNALEALFGVGNVIQPYWIKDIDGLKVGFFGLMGDDAASVAPFASPVSFEEPTTAAAQAAVTALNAAGANFIICISHSGLDEDSALAAAVPGINVIISGHTHEKTTTPITVGTTLIVQAGDDARYLGVLDLDLTTPAPYLSGYELAPINDTITGDGTVQTAVDNLKTEIDTVLSSVLGYSYTYDGIIAETPYDLIAKAGEETNLGNLVADSMRWMVDQVDYNPGDPSSRKVDIAVESNGVIRDDILKGTTGQISFADAFRVLPLGFGLEDDSMGNPFVGYPMVTFYVTASEIRKALEVITTVYPLKGNNSDYWLNISGLKFEYNPKLLIFYRVRRIFLGDETSGYATKPLDTSCFNKKLYKIAINYYVAQFIAVIGDYTYGFLTIVPKDKNGVSYLDKTAHPDGLNEARVDADQVTPGVQELQEWDGFMQYLESLPSGSGGNPEVPYLYAGPTGRIKTTECFISSASL